MNDAQHVDFHCHLDLHSDMQKGFINCDAAKCITYTVTTTPKAFERNANYAKRSEYVVAALGLHPQLVAQRAKEIELFNDLLPSTRYVGEVGLDATRAHYHSFQQQEELFDIILNRCANLGDKILSVHSARCAKKVLDHIETSKVSEHCKVVMHWFSASSSEIRRAVDLGCWFSINQKLITTRAGADLVSIAPRDRILTETDAPFLEKNGQSISAGDVGGIVEALSQHYHCSTEALRKKLVENALLVLS